MGATSEHRQEGISAVQALIAVLDQLEAEAERVLTSLAPTAPDHETIARLVVDLRATRARLLAAKESTRAIIDQSVVQVASAQMTLDKVLGVDGQD